MFDINKEVVRLQQLKYAKVHGLLYKKKQYDPKVSHVDGDIFEQQAIQEGIFIPRGFHNYSVGFGRRLKKSKGQYHKPGGGYSGHTLRRI